MARAAKRPSDREVMTFIIAILLVVIVLAFLQTVTGEMRATQATDEASQGTVMEASPFTLFGVNESDYFTGTGHEFCQRRGYVTCVAEYWFRTAVYYES